MRAIDNAPEWHLEVGCRDATCFQSKLKVSGSLSTNTGTYAMTEYADAKRALERLHRELIELNPSAARSLEEGMEETLTVHRLRLPAQLRRTLASTNVIESAFSIVATVCRNVKR